MMHLTILVDLHFFVSVYYPLILIKVYTYRKHNIKQVDLGFTSVRLDRRYYSLTFLDYIKHFVFIQLKALICHELKVRVKGQLKKSHSIAKFFIYRK